MAIILEFTGFLLTPSIIKPSHAGREFIGNVAEAPPFPGAKNSFLIEDKPDDRA